MRSLIRKCCAGALLAAAARAGLGTAAAQSEAAPPSPPSTTDLSRLVSAVERLVRVLEEQAQERSESREIERLQVLVSIMGIRSRKVESLESDLREIDAEEQNLHQEVTQMKEQLEQLDVQETPSADAPGPEIKAMRKMLQSRQKESEEQLARVEERRVQVQNDLTAARRRLAQLETSLEDWIDKQTSGKN